MNKITCYFNSNYVDINKNSKIIHIVSNSIKEGDIVNKDLFINEIKRKKIFSSILTSSVEIYLNHNISEKDEIYYKYIFDEFNCNQIKILDTSKKLISPTLINSYDMYILYYKNKYYKIIPELLDNYLDILNIKELRVISKVKIPICKTDSYYYNYKNDYFIE